MRFKFLFLVLVMAGCAEKAPPKVDEKIIAQDPKHRYAASDIPNDTNVQPKDKWEYLSDTYGIDNASFKSATISSSDQVIFSFPYNNQTTTDTSLSQNVGNKYRYI